MNSNKYRPRVDPNNLTIERNIPLPAARAVRNKYQQLFGRMEPGECIKCKPDEVTSVSNAMRKWIDDNNKRGQLMVVSQRYCKSGQGDEYVGRVWLADANGRHRSATGANRPARTSTRRSGSAA